jgi:hypothetical protein
VVPKADSHKNLENLAIRKEREGLMNSQRLEWVMSGLNLHTLTKTEDQFIKTALEDFNKNHALTEHQEEKLESLYKEKSKLIPNKNLPPVRESIPKKVKPRKPPWKSRMDMVKVTI